MANPGAKISPVRFLLCVVAKGYTLQQKCPKNRKTTVQLSTPYTDPERHNAQRHRQYPTKPIVLRAVRSARKVTWLTKYESRKTLFVTIYTQKFTAHAYFVLSCNSKIQDRQKDIAQLTLHYIFYGKITRSVGPYTAVWSAIGIIYWPLPACLSIRPSVTLCGIVHVAKRRQVFNKCIGSAPSEHDFTTFNIIHWPYSLELPTSQTIDVAAIRRLN